LYFLRHCERSEAIRVVACAWIASGCALAMTKNRATYYQYINEPFFFVFSLFSPAKLGWGLAMTTGRKNAITMKAMHITMPREV
jgi:hypothetical protein